MNYDKDKVDELTLALLYLTLSSDDSRAYKGMEFAVSNRLHEKGWIEDPRNKNKTVVLTCEGRAECLRLFKKHFGLFVSGDSQDFIELPISWRSLELAYKRSGVRTYLDLRSGCISIQENFTGFSENPQRYLAIPDNTDTEAPAKFDDWLALHGIKRT